MTTNLYAVAGPSTHPSPEEPASPLRSIPSLPANHPSLAVSTSAVPGVGVSKPGLSVDEHGEVLKVPAFLNKLYTMVSDETVNELIYWGDNGDSFFVPNSEQFGRELLPRWFKHSNFSSFVRQLNMYGFHKVPHLQSGALKTETPVELWEFANPYFKRGQPQLLAKVTRKNNRPSTSAPTTTSPVPGVSTRSSAAPALPPQGGGGKYLITDGTTEGENTALVAPNQMIDLSAIQNGIAAIRQTQSTISADLRKLQASNEALWRQAYETQEKQRKHEETIDLIVSFLERLFGTEGEGLKGLKEAMRRGVGARQGRDREGSDGAEEAQGSAKKRRRVGLERMISNRSPVEDDDDDDRLVEIGSSVPLDTPSASGRFQSLPAEDSKAPTPVRTLSDPTLGINALSPMSDFDPLQPSNNNALAPYYSLPPPTSSAYPQPQNQNQSQNQNQKQNVHDQSNLSAPLLSPTTTSSLASSLNLDPMLLQTTIGSLLQSPAAAQMFLNSLNASAQGQAVNGGGRSANGGAAGQDPTLALFSPLPQANQPNPSSSLSHAQPSSSSSSQGQNQNQALLQQNSELLKSYQDALGVSDGLDGLQGSIDELVRSMGLDLPSADGSLSGSGSELGQGQGVGQGVGTDGGAGGEDFNVDEFLESLGKEEDDPLAGAVAVPQPDAPGAGIAKVERE